MRRLKAWARALRRDVHALYFAGRDPRVPWYAKALAIAVAGYALSPVDLIPDFIPLLGYLDDVILVPLGILLVIRLIPPHILAEHRDRASRAGRLPISHVSASTIVAIWVAASCAGARLLFQQRHTIIPRCDAAARGGDHVLATGTRARCAKLLIERGRHTQEEP